MDSRIIDEKGLKRYISLSKEILQCESMLYESEEELSKNEFKIAGLLDKQNKIRFDEDDNDFFREQLETVLRLLAANFEDFGFDHNLYFDLVYNLMLREYERVISLDKEDDSVAFMLEKIGIDEDIKEKMKAFLAHECGGKAMGCDKGSE